MHRTRQLNIRARQSSCSQPQYTAHYCQSTLDLSCASWAEVRASGYCAASRRQRLARLVRCRAAVAPELGAVNIASPGGECMTVAPQRSRLAYVEGAAACRRAPHLGPWPSGPWLCVCNTLGVRVCDCGVCGLCGCVRMAVRAAGAHSVGHCGTKCLACCHCPHRWPPPRPL